MSKDFVDLIGKQFRYGGRGPDDYDCYGLCREIYRRLGERLPEFASTSDPEVNRISMAVGRRFFTELPGPQPFCLVTFFIRPPYTSHVGVVLPDLFHFMHIMENTNVTIERLDSPIWARRITGYFVPGGIAHGA